MWLRKDLRFRRDFPNAAFFIVCARGYFRRNLYKYEYLQFICIYQGGCVTLLSSLQQQCTYGMLVHDLSRHWDTGCTLQLVRSVSQSSVWESAACYTKDSMFFLRARLATVPPGASFPELISWPGCPATYIRARHRDETAVVEHHPKITPATTAVCNNIDHRKLLMLVYCCSYSRNGAQQYHGVVPTAAAAVSAVGCHRKRVSNLWRQDLAKETPGKHSISERQSSKLHGGPGILASSTHCCRTHVLLGAFGTLWWRR